MVFLKQCTDYHTQRLFKRSSNKSNTQDDKFWVELDKLKIRYKENCNFTVLDEHYEIREQRNDLIKSISESKGVYVGVKYDQDTDDKIIQFSKDSKLPNINTEIHSSLIYSTKYDDVTVLGKIDEYAYPKEFKIFQTQDNKNALVLILESKFLTNRHNEFMGNYDLSFDYPEFNAHITLSYSIEDYDISALEISKLPKEFHIIEEYCGNLKSNWKPGE